MSARREARRLRRSALGALVGRIYRVMVARFDENDLLTYASAIALQLLVALIPLALLSLVLIGDFGLEHVWSQQIGPQVFDRVRPPTWIAINSEVQGVIDPHRTQWLVAAVLLTIWEVSGAVRAVMGGLNGIYDTGEDRSIWHRFGLSFALAVGIAVCALGALLAATFGRHVAGLLPGPGALWLIVRWLVAIALLWVVVALLVRFAPARRRPLRWVSVGSVLVIGTWVAISFGYRFYIGNVVNFRSPFGLMTSGIVLIGYLYASAIVLLVGAQVDSELRDESEGQGEGFGLGEVF